jgi:hypothetical protein
MLKEAKNEEPANSDQARKQKEGDNISTTKDNFSD